MEGDMDMVFVVSDFHGNMEAWINLRNSLSENDIVFMLGDACDRNPYGIEILKEVKADCRFRYILGNHDDFILRTYRSNLVYNKRYTSEMAKICWNGNTRPSYGEWEMLRKRDPKTFYELIEWLAQCDVYRTVVVEGGVFRLAHAKYPKEMDKLGLSMSWKDMEKYNSDLLYNTLWDRYRDNGVRDYITSGAVSVIGHTPSQHGVIVPNALYNVDCYLGHGSDTVRVFCLNNGSFYNIDRGNRLPSGSNDMMEVSGLLLEGFVDKRTNKLERDVKKVAMFVNEAQEMSQIPVYLAVGIVKDENHKYNEQRVHTSYVKQVINVEDTFYIVTRNSCYRCIM